MTLVSLDPPDLLMVDLMMPVVDGLRFLRWLRQEAKLTVPALVFTSFDRPNLVEEIHTTGGTELVRKPVKLNDLLERVKRLLAA